MDLLQAGDAGTIQSEFVLGTCWGLLMSPLINSLEVQRDIQEWFRQLLGMGSAYPLRFALAAGLVLLIFGLFAFRLSSRKEQNQAAGDWLVAEIQTRRRGAVMLLLFCLLGILVGVQFARFTFTRHSAAPKQPVPIARNPADQIRVWEDPRHGVYHCSGSGWFGKTRGGRVASLRQAQYDGYHPYAKPCPGESNGSDGHNKASPLNLAH